MPNTDGELKPAEETGESLEGDQQSQIGDMFTDFAGDAPQPDPGAERQVAQQEEFLKGEDGSDDGPAGDQLVAEANEDGSYDIEDSSQDEAVEEVEGEVEEATEEVEDSTDPQLKTLMEQNQKLMDTVQMLLQSKQGEGGEAGEGEPTGPKLEIDPADLVSDDAAERFEEDPVGFLRELASDIYTRAREDMIRDIPTLIETSTNRQMAYSQARQQFNSKYPQLASMMGKNDSIQKLAQDTANKIQKEHPGWTLNRIFDETGKELGALLKVDKEADEVDSKAKKQGNNQPKPPKAKRRGGQKDDRSGLQKELDDMVSSLA